MNANPLTTDDQDGLNGMLLNGRYRIVRKLGSGGFSQVWEAHDEKLDRKRVVVKVLHTSKVDDWALRNFHDAVKALSAIRHRGVVSVTDQGTTPEKIPFLVMDFIEGVDLSKLVKPGGMEFARAAEIARQIGDALSAVHEKNIYHRDLRPANIMVESSLGGDWVRLIDFGNARIASIHGSDAQSTHIAGMYPYMSPEQADGNGSAPSDVYSFGVVLFELLAGMLPVETPIQRMAVANDVLEKKLREHRPNLPDTAAKLVLRALSIDPAMRPASARLFGDDLAAALRPRAAESGPADELIIAHVLFADIVGYSLLSMEEQRRLLAQLQDIVRQAPHFREAEASRTMNSLPTGDGMALVFFGDPTAAAECALEIGATVKGHPLLKLRMGLHTGPVYRVKDINKNLNVAGGGINLAQRVMDAGDAGHILLSSGMADVLMQIGGWKGWLTDLGEHSVKHGALIRFYNLANSEAGNPAWPVKWGSPGRKPSRRWILGAVAAGLLVCVGAFISVIRNLSNRRTPEPNRAPTVKLSLDYFVTVQKFKNSKPDGAEFRIAREILLGSDDGVAVTVGSTTAGYLYIVNDGFQENGSESINILFPNPGKPAAIAAGRTLRIPDTEWLRLDLKRGTEKFYVIWSAAPVPDFERAKDRKDSIFKGTDTVSIRAAPQLEQLRAVLEKFKIPTAQIQVDNRAKVSKLTATQDVLVHLIQFEHY